VVARTSARATLPTARTRVAARRVGVVHTGDRGDRPARRRGAPPSRASVYGRCGGACKWAHQPAHGGGRVPCGRAWQRRLRRRGGRPRGLLRGRVVETRHVSQTPQLIVSLPQVIGVVERCLIDGWVPRNHVVRLVSRNVETAGYRAREEKGLHKRTCLQMRRAIEESAEVLM